MHIQFNRFNLIDSIDIGDSRIDMKVPHIYVFISVLNVKYHLNLNCETLYKQYIKHAILHRHINKARYNSDTYESTFQTEL